MQIILAGNSLDSETFILSRRGGEERKVFSYLSIKICLPLWPVFSKAGALNRFNLVYHLKSSSIIHVPLTYDASLFNAKRNAWVIIFFLSVKVLLCMWTCGADKLFNECEYVAMG